MVSEAEIHKKTKYQVLASSNTFVPVFSSEDVQYQGTWGVEALGLVTELRGRILCVSGDHISDIAINPRSENQCAPSAL